VQGERIDPTNEKNSKPLVEIRLPFQISVFSSAREGKKNKRNEANFGLRRAWPKDRMTGLKQPAPKGMTTRLATKLNKLC